MKIFKTSIALLCAAAVSACTFPEKAENPLMPKRFSYANEETQINLQQPFTRVIVKCYSTKYEPAETCAKLFESKRDMSVLKIFLTKTANYRFSQNRNLSHPAVGAPGK